MAAAFSQIKGFIQTYTGYNFDEVSESEIDALKNFISQSFKSIRWEIETDLEQTDDPVLKGEYMRNLQSQLTYLTAGLNGFEKQRMDEKSKSVIFNWVLVEIFHLLEHLWTYFPSYFNLEQQLPQNYITIYRETHHELWHNLDLLLDEYKIDNELKALITDFCDATENSEKFVIGSWQQFFYLLHILKAIEKFRDNQELENPDLEFLKMFVSNDLNSIQVYGYCIKYMEKITLGEGTFQEQQQELLYLLKVFRQVRVDAYSPYDPKVQSLKLSITESIETELTYLEQKEKVLVASFKGTDSEVPSKFYFNVAVTLAELMFFFRVMLEVKVIYTKFNSYIYEFISNHIRTERADNISKKSMRNHFSNKPFPDRVVHNVKSWLEKMIHHINLHYNV